MLNPVKLEPVYKDYIWGGSKLKKLFKKGKDINGAIAESWELSTHPDGESKIADKSGKGMKFSEYIKMQDKNVVGSKSELDEPPVLIKFIDAKENLSVQVHPNNDYARKYEHDNGKTEMWVVLSHEPGAALYYGMREKLTKEEVRAKIEDHTILDALNRVEVQDGDVYAIPAGTIHAIGAGMVICEIQQKSNVTYRLYDYGRIGKDGKERELHIDKALEVANLEPVVPDRSEEIELCNSSEYRLKLLDSCQYFQTYQYDLFGELHFSTSQKTFVCIIMLKGNCTLKYKSGEVQLKPGDTTFLPAQEAEYMLEGGGELLAVSL